MTKKIPRLHFPENRLAALLTRAQGRPRAHAVRDGALRLESQRQTAMATLEELITALERGPLELTRLSDIAQGGDRIVTLAQGFGLFPLADAARRLCDMTALLAKRSGFDAAALDVHIRALRLFAPGSPALDDAEAALVLGRIAALAAYLAVHPAHPLSDP